MLGRRHLSDWFRQRRAELLREVIEQAPRRGKTLRIVDLGGAVQYWKGFGLDYLARNRVHVTLVNIASDELSGADTAPGLVDHRIGDACALELEDNSFDLCHSNSVIEHVGSWQAMAAFAREARRIAPSHFVQTPNRNFPVDPHFPAIPLFHRLPRPARAALVYCLPISYTGRAKSWDHACAKVASSELLGPDQMRKLFPESRIQFEKLGPLPKSIIMTKIARPHSH